MIARIVGWVLAPTFSPLPFQWHVTNSSRHITAHFNASDDESFDFDKMRDMFGPGQIDQQIRQAIQFCWMGLPKEKQNIDELERQIRRLVDRALSDVREDHDEFSGDTDEK